MTVLKEEGFDVTRPGVGLPIDRATESRIEARVVQKTICLVNGLEQQSSHFDTLLVEVSTTSGSSYAVRGGQIHRHDFTLTTPVKRTTTGLLRYESSVTPLPGMSQAAISGSTSTLDSTAKGISSFLTMIM